MKAASAFDGLESKHLKLITLEERKHISMHQNKGRVFKS